LLLGCFFHLPVFHCDTKCSASCSIKRKRKGVHELAVIISALPSLANVEQQLDGNKEEAEEAEEGEER